MLINYTTLQNARVKSLRIALLASNPELYSNQRIMEAGVTRGHEMIFVNIRQCYINVSSDNPAVHYRGGETLIRYRCGDPAYPPISNRIWLRGAKRHFEHLGAYCLNDAISISRSRDKLRSLQLLVNKGIDIPVTGFADSPEDTSRPG
jgi:ribosomal protein S6--L-glutamate ligase